MEFESMEAQIVDYIEPKRCTQLTVLVADGALSPFLTAAGPLPAPPCCPLPAPGRLIRPAALVAGLRGLAWGWGLAGRLTLAFSMACITVFLEEG